MKPTKITITFVDLHKKTWTATAKREECGDFFVRGDGPVPEDERDCIQGGFSAGIRSFMEREDEEAAA